MPGSLSLIVNPAAARGRALRVLPEVIAELGRLGGRYEVTRSASLAHAGELAAAAAAAGQAAVAVGGDGMAGAVAGAVAGTAAGFGVIPAGRGNDLARVLGIPAPPREAAAVLAAGRTRPVDLISVTAPGRPACVVAGSVYMGIPSVAGEIANAACPDGTPVTAEFVIGAYHQLFQIEKLFRMTKSDLQARPVYHRKRDSIEAHLTIVLAALAISRWIQHQTGWSLRRFVKTARRYRTIQIQADDHVITAADPLPDELRQAIESVNRSS